MAKLKQFSSPYLPRSFKTRQRSTPKQRKEESLPVPEKMEQNHERDEQAFKRTPATNRIKFNRKDFLDPIDENGMSALSYLLSHNEQTQPHEGEAKAEDRQPEVSSLELITQGSGTLSRNLSRVKLSINNYDKSLNEISRVPQKPYSWKARTEEIPQQDNEEDLEEESAGFQAKLRYKEKYNPNQEFSDNVMHIIDRSHQKYDLQIDDHFTIETQTAKQKIKTQLKLMKLLGPNKYQEYTEEQKKIIAGGKQHRGSLGIYPIKKPQQRNELFHKEIVDRAQSLRNGYRIEKEDDSEYQEALKKQKSASKYFMPREYMYGNQNKQTDYILPDIKDYNRIVARALDKLKGQNYDDWSMLVKMCFDYSYKQSKNPYQVQVGSVELMRFHPFFNKLSYYAVKDFLNCCKLVKLRPNQLLYRQDDKNPSVYIVMFGKVVLHHKTLGALGVLDMTSTIGEETLAEPKCKAKKDAAYAEDETYLLEFEDTDWSRIKQLLISTGNRSDYILIDQLIKHNYYQKKNWRLFKQRQYINIKS